MSTSWKATHRHKKGGYYRVLMVGVRDTETLSVYVVYDNEAGQTWARPFDEFYDGRFTFLDGENETPVA